MTSDFHYIKQFKNIFKDKKDFLIVGAPGTGKTTFLTELILYLCDIKKIDPKKILIFTFNRKSSKYLRDQIAIKAEKTVPEIDVKTFYSFCLDFFKDFLLNKGLKKIATHHECESNFKKTSLIETIFVKELDEIKILTAPEQWNLLAETITEADESKIPKIKKLFTNKNTKEDIAQEIFDYILRAQENLKKPSELFNKFNPYTSKTLTEINTIYSMFIEALRVKNWFNYGKLLVDTCEILNSQNELALHYKKKYDFIFIEELHELNFAQFKLLKKISNDNIIYFGDDDQSVFKFRGTNINIFFEVFEKLPKERKLFLNYNYRSTNSLLNLATDFIAKNKRRIAKAVTKKIPDNPLNKYLVNSGPEGKNCEEIIIKAFENKYAELNFIKNKIIFLNEVLKIPLKEIALILKGTDFEIDLIENYFYQNSISFFRRSSRGVIKNKYINYLLNICRLIHLLSIYNEKNKTYTQNIEPENYVNKINSIFRSLLLSGFLNIDPIFFKEVEFSYRKAGNGISNYTLFEYINCRLKKSADKENKNYEAISKFLHALIKHKKNIKNDAFNFIRGLIEEKNLGLLKDIKHYQELEQNDRNLLMFFTNFLTSVRNFVNERDKQNDISFYLDFMDSFENNQFIEETEESLTDNRREDGVQLISFYDCKNIEFDAIFIPFLNNGYLPTPIPAPQIYENDFLTYLVEGRFSNDNEIKQSHIENERRILFTGISRSRNHLYITCSLGSESSLFYEELKEIKAGMKETVKAELAIIHSAALYDKYFTSPEKSLMRKKALISQLRTNQGKKTDKNREQVYLRYLKDHYDPDKWWSQVTENKNSLNPFVIDKNSCYFSFSAIDTYDDCPLKYKIRYYYKIKTQEENFSLLTGSLYHEIINQFFNLPEKPDLDFLLRLMQENLDLKIDDFKFNFYFNEIKEEMKNNLINFYNNFPKTINAGNFRDLKGSILTEKEFTFDISETDKIIGKIDFINLGNDEVIELIDFKSSQKKYSEKELEEELQLKIYYLALKKSKDLREFLKNMDSKTVLPGYYVLGNNSYFTLNISRESESETMERILDIINNIKKENFEIKPRNYNSCKYCEYKIFCEKYYGKQL